MLTIQYTLVTLVAYLGLLAGVIISLLAKEELSAGRKYFVLLQHSLFVTTLLLTLYAHKTASWISYSLILIIVLVLTFARTKNTSIVAYPVLGAILFLNRSASNTFFLTAALIFLYGMPTAALHVHARKRGFVRLFLLSVSFLVVSLGLYFLLG